MSMGDKHAERAALLILKEAMPELTRQQASTIRGQILKGEIYAAMRGLHRILQATDGAKKARDLLRLAAIVVFGRSPINYPDVKEKSAEHELAWTIYSVLRYTRSWHENPAEASQ